VISLSDINLPETKISVPEAPKSPDSASPKPNKFSLTIPGKKADPIKLSEAGKRTFEDWNKTAQLRPGPFPPLPPLPPSSSRDKWSHDDSNEDRSSRDTSSKSRRTYESSRSRDRPSRYESRPRDDSSRSRDRSSRDGRDRRDERHRESYEETSSRRASDNDILFGRGPAESAKRRSETSLSTSKWKVVSQIKEETTVDDAEDEPVAKKRRFRLHRDAEGGRSKGVIKTTEDMFAALMKSCDKKKKS